MPLAKTILLMTLLGGIGSCGRSSSLLKYHSIRPKTVDTRTLTDVAVVPRLEEGDSFIWGYYPDGGSKARMYEGYVKLPDLHGSPTLAFMTLFPEEAPAGKWVLHDGIGFDYDDVLSAFATPTSRSRPREQMFGWDAGRQAWFSSTNRPNTSANSEKFNYRQAVSLSPYLAWRTKFACYDGRDITDVDSAKGTCSRGETVFQQIPQDDPPYVFQSFYSLASGVALYKLFNDHSTDPDARVAMRLLYAQSKDGERTFGNRRISPAYLASFKEMVRDVLARGKR